MASSTENATLIANKFAPLSGTFWGDHKDDEPLEHWETTVDIQFLQTSRTNVLCIKAKQDRGSSILGSPSHTQTSTSVQSTEKSEAHNNFHDQCSDSEYIPSSFEETEAGKLTETDYLPVSRPLSNKKIKKMEARQLQERRELEKAGLTPYAINEHLAIKQRELAQAKQATNIENQPLNDPITPQQ